MRRRKILIVATLFGTGFAALFAIAERRAEAQPPVIVAPVTRTDVYAAKFLCGTLPPLAAGQHEGPVKPGNYQTAINVHNPNPRDVDFQKKAVLLFDSAVPDTGFEVPKKPSDKRDARLQQDWGLEIDCDTIRTELLGGAAVGPFIKGWVILEVKVAGAGTRVLDVVAAYTAHGLALDPTHGLLPEGFSIDVERVTPNRVF